MYYLLMAFVLSSVFWPLFGPDLQMPMGLSVKNLLLYSIAGLLILRGAVSGTLKIDNRGLFFCYVFLILYAALSIAIVDYWTLIDNYDTLLAAIYLKNQVIDPFVIIGVCYYGISNVAEAQRLLDVFLVSIGIAFSFTIVSAAGLIELDVGYVDYSFGTSRLTGPFGDPNELGALASVCLPLLLATAVDARGIKRVLLSLLVVSAGIVVLSTASRSAVLGLVFGLLVTLALYRKLPLLRIFAALVGTAILVAGLASILISPEIVMTTVERFLFTGQTLQYATSGRTALWSYALEKMADQPISFITGFGWNAYEASNFALDVHSHYLNYLYNVGLVGAITTSLILVVIANKVRIASLKLESGTEFLFAAFCTGWWALIFALAFIEMYVTWPLLAILAGTFLRISQFAEPKAISRETHDFGSGSVRPIPLENNFSEIKESALSSSDQRVQRGARGFAR